MNFREWANNNPAITATVVAVILGVILLVVVLQLRGPRIPGGSENPAYFWDIETGEVFTAGVNNTPPITAPSGGEGVKVQLFSCGSCSPEEWFGYLQTLTEEGHAARKELAELGEPAGPNVQRLNAEIRDNHLIRSLDGDQWVPATSPEGERLQDEMRDRCGGSPTRCQPE